MGRLRGSCLFLKFRILDWVSCCKSDLKDKNWRKEDLTPSKGFACVGSKQGDMGLIRLKEELVPDSIKRLSGFEVGMRLGVSVYIWGSLSFW